MTKLEETINILQQELASGQYPPGERFPSEYELVRRFAISRGTANKAVSMLCKGGFLERGRRGAGTVVLKKILCTHRNIAFIGSYSNLFNGHIIDGVARTAFQRNYWTSILHPKLTELPRCLEEITSGQDYLGVVTTGYGMLPKELPIPVVYIDEGMPQYLPDRHHVVNRNFDGAAMMMRTLWEKGHREIAIAANNSYLLTHRWFRVQGFLETLHALSGKDAKSHFYATVEGTVLEARMLIEKILEQHPGTTAIATDCDDLAFLLIGAAKQLGIERKKLIITGFGNLMNFIPGLDEALNIPDVEQNPFLLGSVACDLLLDFIEKKCPADTPVMRYVDVNLVRQDAIPKIP